MAVRTAVKSTVLDINVAVWSWSGLLNGDTGGPVQVLAAGVLLAQLVSGTLGVGGACGWQGSLDGGATWATLTGDGSTAISLTGLLTEKMIAERAVLVRPIITAGDGTTSLAASLLAQISPTF